MIHYDEYIQDIKDIICGKCKDEYCLDDNCSTMKRIHEIFDKIDDEIDSEVEDRAWEMSKGDDL